MRYFIFTALLLLTIFGSCSKEENSIIYSGTLTELRQTIMSDSPSQEISSQETIIEVTFILEGDKLIRQNSSGKDFCEGDYTLTDELFEFSTDDCGCWCECSPFVDCGGDILMGTYEAEIVDGTLHLLQEGTFEANGSLFSTKITVTGVFTQL